MTTCFSISQAVETFSVSESRIRRDLKAGKFPNARKSKDRTRAWKIPLKDLKNAGYEKRNNAGENRKFENENKPGIDELQELKTRVAILETELKLTRELLEAHRLRADELATLMKANLVLEAGEKMTLVDPVSDSGHDLGHDRGDPLPQTQPPAEKRSFLTYVRTLFKR
jgi:hypothetical protein